MIIAGYRSGFKHERWVRREEPETDLRTFGRSSWLEATPKKSRRDLHDLGSRNCPLSERISRLNRREALTRSRFSHSLVASSSHRGKLCSEKNWHSSSLESKFKSNRKELLIELDWDGHRNIIGSSYVDENKSNLVHSRRDSSKSRAPLETSQTNKNNVGTRQLERELAETNGDLKLRSARTQRKRSVEKEISCYSRKAGRKKNDLHRDYTMMSGTISGSDDKDNNSFLANTNLDWQTRNGSVSIRGIDDLNERSNKGGDGMDDEDENSMHPSGSTKKIDCFADRMSSKTEVSTMKNDVTRLSKNKMNTTNSCSLKFNGPEKESKVGMSVTKNNLNGNDISSCESKKNQEWSCEGLCSCNVVEKQQCGEIKTCSNTCLLEEELTHGKEIGEPKVPSKINSEDMYSNGLQNVKSIKNRVHGVEKTDLVRPLESGKERTAGGQTGKRKGGQDMVDPRRTQLTYCGVDQAMLTRLLDERILLSRRHPPLVTRIVSTHTQAYLRRAPVYLRPDFNCYECAFCLKTCWEYLEWKRHGKICKKIY